MVDTGDVLVLALGRKTRATHLFRVGKEPSKPNITIFRSESANTINPLTFRIHSSKDQNRDKVTESSQEAKERMSFVGPREHLRCCMF
jgi:hypothetical protein